MTKTLWNEWDIVPSKYLKKIEAGRLKGKIDINPQFRYKILTEKLGLCGIGWKYTINNIETINCNNGEIIIQIFISLYIKINDEWSDAIIGIGGNKLATQEKSGIYYNDEAYKMALTDALSVACKMIGIASTVYEGYPETKYSLSISDTKEYNTQSIAEAENARNDFFGTGEQLFDTTKITDARNIPQHIIDKHPDMSKSQLLIAINKGTIKLEEK